MNNRLQKLNSEFKRYIDSLLRQKVKDPRLTEMFTVVAVDCDRDLSTAKVYVSVFSADSVKAEETFKAMHVRKVPEFRFTKDTSMSYGQKIDRILNEINKKQGDN